MLLKSETTERKIENNFSKCKNDKNSNLRIFNIFGLMMIWS